MKPICRLLICIALLWACVGVGPVTAEDVDIANCLRTDLAPTTRFVACRAAAEAGNVDTQFNLGYMYNIGQGITQDYIEAAKWYRRAAEQGLPIAQNKLGDMYNVGQGVPEDDAEAVKWYRRAAEQDYADAQFNLGYMYNVGRGVPQDYTEAVKWYRRAAEQGNTVAQANLGRLYGNGQGVSQDYTLAHMWLNLAGTDFEDARELRDTVAKQMTPAQIAEAQRLAREWSEAHRAGADSVSEDSGTENE